MRIAVLGTGYVGLSTGVSLSEIGHTVVCVDVNEQKINRLRNAISPIYEPGLQELLEKNMKEGRLDFTTSHQDGINGAEIIIIAVGTPQGEDGAADLFYLEQAAKDISSALTQSSIVVIKSTVPVGTNEHIKNIMDQNLNENVKIHIVSNPEFLRQGSAMKDTLHADRIIIGYENLEAANKVKEMYEPLHVPVIMTTIRSAEMIKYASNAFLATKISFINEMANLCEAVGANVLDVAKGMGMDHRIGEAFLQAGIGYGGSCFPKDVKALLHTASSYGSDFSLLKETISINDEQQILLVKKALKRFGDLKGRKIALLGLAFKPETDDMREAPSIKISQMLADLEAEVVAYDPVAIENAKKVIGNTIKYVDTVNEAILDADAVMIVTEWNEFKRLDLKKLTEKLKNPIVFDGRNCIDEQQIMSCGSIEYYSIGKPPMIMD